MTISLIASLVILLYAGVLILVNLLSVRKRSWILALIRIGITVVTAIVSIPLAKLIAGAASDAVYEWIVPMLGGEIGGFLTEVPVGAEGIRVIAALLIAPIVYLVVFLVLRGVLSLVARIVGGFVPFLRDRSSIAVTMPLGAVNGLLIAVITLVPLCGFIMLGSNALHTLGDMDAADDAVLQSNQVIYLSDVEETEPEEVEPEESDDLLQGLERNPLLMAIYKTVGAPIFTSLTTGKLEITDADGEAVEINLERELGSLLKTVGYAMDVMDALEKETFEEEDKELLFRMADSFFESEWVRMFAADTLSTMSEHWLNGESFAGLQRPQLDSALNPTLNVILNVMATESTETLEEDIHVLLDVVGDLMVNDLLTADGDYANMVQRLGSEGVLSTMLNKLESNERMQGVSTELKSLGIRLVTNMMGTDLLENGEYAEMLANVSETLTQALTLNEEERDALVIQSIQTNFTDAGFDVPTDLALEMAHSAMDELGDDGLITSDELSTFLLEHADQGFEFIPEDLPEAL